MLLNQAFSIKEAPRALFWIGIFLISFSGMFYLGLNPELIEKWYLVLVGFNVLMSLIAIYYIVLSMRKLKLNTEQGVIGSRFTWSFIKIVPVLVLLPVLSFYLFSFESIRDNLKKAEESTEEFNLTAGYIVEELSNNTEFIVFKYYRDRTVNIGKVLDYFEFFTSSPKEKQILLNIIVRDGFACELKLFDSLKNIVAQSKSDKVCLPDYGHDLSTDRFTLTAYYASDLNIINLTRIPII